MFKICKLCNTSKPVETFSKNARYADGLWCYCKVCDCARAAKHRAANPERAAEIARKSLDKTREERNARRRERRAANPEQTKAQRQADYAKYRERELASMRAYKEQNREALQAKQAERYWADPAAARERQNAYRSANAATVRNWRRTRQAAQQSAVPMWADHAKIQLAYDAADLLMQVTGDWYEVDHIVPLRGAIARKHVVCGLHVDYNLQVIPKSDNRRKSNSIWPDMPAKLQGN